MLKVIFRLLGTPLTILKASRLVVELHNGHGADLVAQANHTLNELGPLDDACSSRRGRGGRGVGGGGGGVDSWIPRQIFAQKSWQSAPSFFFWEACVTVVHDIKHLVQIWPLKVHAIAFQQFCNLVRALLDLISRQDPVVVPHCER